MNYGVVLNLDHKVATEHQLRELLVAFRNLLSERGFMPRGRMFVIEADYEEVVALCRETLAILERSYHDVGEDIYVYLQDFYCVDLNAITNFLVPDETHLAVEELPVEDIPDAFRAAPEGEGV